MVIVACMSEWNSQLYENLPAEWKVWLNCCPGRRVPESNDPSSAVTVCGRSPVLVQVTVMPCETCSDTGSKAKSTTRISTAGSTWAAEMMAKDSSTSARSGAVPCSPVSTVE